MLSRKPYGTPPAPAPLKHIRRKWLFGQMLAEAHTRSSVALARSIVINAVMILMMIAISAIMITSYVSHAKGLEHVFGCPRFVGVLLCLVTIFAVGGCVVHILVGETKTLRAAYRKFENRDFLVRAFNLECTAVNHRIRNFEKYSDKENFELIIIARSLSEMRPKLLKEVGVRYVS